MIGLLIPNIEFNFFATLSNIIEKRARERGYNIIICNTADDPMLESNYLAIVNSGIIDGIIIDPCGNTNAPIFSRFLQEGIPFVFVDRYVAGIEANYVGTDNKWGSYLLTQKMIERGHTNIAIVIKQEEKKLNNSVCLDRLEGYLEAMLENNLTSREIYVKNGDTEIESILYRALTSPNRPSALFLQTTWWSIRALLKVVDRLSWTIPDDIDVAAFDTFTIRYSDENDMKIASHLKSPLLILEQNPVKIAILSIDLLINTIEKKDSQELKSIHLIKPRSCFT